MERASGFELGLERDRGGRLNLSLGAPPDAHGRRAGAGRGQGRYSPTPALGPAGGLRVTGGTPCTAFMELGVGAIEGHINYGSNRFAGCAQPRAKSSLLGSPIISTGGTMLTNSGSVRCKASAPPATVGWPIDKNHPVYTGVVE